MFMKEPFVIVFFIFALFDIVDMFARFSKASIYIEIILRIIIIYELLIKNLELFVL
jgi:hypothetical protein